MRYKKEMMIYMLTILILAIVIQVFRLNTIFR